MHMMDVHQQDVGWPHDEGDPFAWHHQNSTPVMAQLEYNQISDSPSKITLICVIAVARIEIDGHRAEHRVVILEHRGNVLHELSLPAPGTRQLAFIDIFHFPDQGA